MVGTTAQLVALCCHFNGHARGVGPRPLVPGNSTCSFCESIHFVRPEAEGSGPPAWRTVATTPDEWLSREAIPGRSAFLLHTPVENPRIPARMSAAFVGGGGRWLLALHTETSKDLWQASWEVGNQQAADRRIWRVRYALVAENADVALPASRTVDAATLQLREALADVVAFADEHRTDGFAACFRRALQCLESDDPFREVHHKDLAPEGLLDLPARRLLAACQAAWVFGGMGSWNDLGFEGAEQERYDRVSDRLFTLINEAVCVAAAASADVRPI